MKKSLLVSIVAVLAAAVGAAVAIAVFMKKSRDCFCDDLDFDDIYLEDDFDDYDSTPGDAMPPADDEVEEKDVDNTTDDATAEAYGEEK